MVEKLYYIFIVCLISFIVIVIITDQIGRIKRKDKVIIKLRKGHGPHLILSLVWLIILGIYSYILINRVREVYYTLGREYINNVYQLFDLEYLKTLRKYFYENTMLVELNSIAFYQGELLNMLTWIIGSCCIFLLNFYKAWRPDEILKDGIVVSGKFIKCDRISGYRRGNLHEKKWMSRKIRYYDYFVTLKRRKPKSNSGLDNELKLYVSGGNEDFVDSNLERFIKKSCDSI